MTFEKRQASDSKFYEYRATTLVQAPVQAVIDAIWLGVTGSIPPTVKKRAVLSKTDTEYLVYDQIKAPVVSDRDVTIKIRKMARGDGIGEIRFDAMNWLGPPPDPQYVRLPVVRGAWTVTPEAGGTRLTYECYSEPGGSIPAFLARGAQQDQIAIDVGRVLVLLHPNKP